MTNAGLLAVPNLSEGRDLRLIADIARPSRRVVLIDGHSDPDHNRSVLTYAGDSHDMPEEMTSVVRRAAAALDLRRHEGVHPRMGVLDVLPFVSLDGPGSDAVAAAHRTAELIEAELHIPVLLYGDASPAPITLPELRRAKHRRVHPTAGVVCIGVRGPLVAFNVNGRGSLPAARRAAASVRETGVVGALGLSLESRGLVQVSMNLLQPAVVGPRAAFDRVVEAAGREDLEIVETEVAGVVPDEVAEQLDGLPWAVRPRTVSAAFEEAEHAAQRAVLAAAVGRVVDDVRTSTGLVADFALDWIKPTEDGWSCRISAPGTEIVVSLYAAWTEDATARFVADEVASRLLDHTFGGWPPCPGHVHPLEAQLRGGRAAWVCPADGAERAAVGELGALRRPASPEAGR